MTVATICLLLSLNGAPCFPIDFKHSPFWLPYAGKYTLDLTFEGFVTPDDQRAMASWDL